MCYQLQMKDADGQRAAKLRTVCVALEIRTRNMKHYTNRKMGCQESSSKRKQTNIDTIQNRQ